MLSSIPSVALYMANEARQHDFESRAAQERRAALAGSRSGGLLALQPRLAVQPAGASRLGNVPSYFAIDLRRQALLDDAQDWLAAEPITPFERGPSALTRARRTVGAVLLRLGQRLNGVPRGGIPAVGRM